MRIHQRFHFSSALKRMAVLASLENASGEIRYLAAVKGAPETLHAMVRAETGEKRGKREKQGFGNAGSPRGLPCAEGKWAQSMQEGKLRENRGSGDARSSKWLRPGPVVREEFQDKTGNLGMLADQGDGRGRTVNSSGITLNYPEFPQIPQGFSQIPPFPLKSPHFPSFPPKPSGIPSDSSLMEYLPGFFSSAIPMSQQLPRDPSGILARGRAGPGPGLQRAGSPEPPAGEKMGKPRNSRPGNAGREIGKRRGVLGVEFGAFGESFQGNSHS